MTKLDTNDPTVQKVQELLKNEINPGLQTHGGFAQLVDIKDSVVFLKLGGGCQGCRMARMTIKDGIEVRIKEAIPEIIEVVDVTDHAMGAST